MKFRSFFWILIAGAVTFLLIAVIGLGWLASQSSIKLLAGGVNTLPQSTAFLPKQTLGMVSLLVNPEKLNGLHQLTLPLQQRNRDHLEWRQWETDLFAKIGFDYRQDLQPWLGDEITLAITTLDYDRYPQNGAQPGYLLVMSTQNPRLAQECLRKFYSQQNNIAVEQYKGVNIIAPQVTKINSQSELWNSGVVGNLVLFANHPQILRQAINQAQAVNLNLSQSENYQTAISNIRKPRIALGYFDVLAISAWLDKSPTLATTSNQQIFAGSLSLKETDLLAQTWLTLAESNHPSTATRSFLNNPELKQIISSLSFDRHNSTYIDLQTSKSLLEEQIPLYKVSKLAIKSLFPQLRGIAIRNLGSENNLQRTEVLFQLSPSN